MGWETCRKSDDLRQAIRQGVVRGTVVQTLFVRHTHTTGAQVVRITSIRQVRRSYGLRPYDKCAEVLDF